MKFNKFIRSVNIIYNILFVAITILALYGAQYLYKSYISQTLFSTPDNRKFTIYSLSILCIFAVYFVLYIVRLIINTFRILKLKYSIDKEEIENELDNIKFKKDKIIITDNYLIVGAYILKIIKLENISCLFLTHSHKNEEVKTLNIICDNNKDYTINNYYSEELYKNLKKYVTVKNPDVSFGARQKDLDKMEQKVLILDIFLAVMALTIIFTFKYIF